jgi:hypothetical protein
MLWTGQRGSGWLTLLSTQHLPSLPTTGASRASLAAAAAPVPARVRQQQGQQQPQRR